MSSLRWEGTYQNIVRTPASAADVLTGHLLWIGLRVAFSSTLFLFVLVISLGGTSALAVLTPLVAALTAVAVAAPIGAFTARRENDQGFALVSRLIITPLFIFSGTFTTVDSLPQAIQVVVKLFPAFHGIELSRDLMNNTASIGSAAGNLLPLLLWSCVGWASALPAFRRALTR